MLSLSFVFMIPQFSEEAVDDWIAMTVEADILLVPGIGPDEARLLAVEDPTHGAVTNTFELLGKWLWFHRRIDATLAMPFTADSTPGCPRFLNEHQHRRSSADIRGKTYFLHTKRNETSMELLDVMIYLFVFILYRDKVLL
jgi:hypothetical protein